MITQTARNWISYLADALINARTMPSWEAAEYLTDNLFDASPNTKLLESKVPHEAVTQFLQRIYGPIVEAGAREAETEPTSRVQVFTDISLMSETTVLIVSIAEQTQASKLVLIDWVRAWDFVFPNAEAFNAWAETRYQQVRVALSRDHHTLPPQARQDAPLPVDPPDGRFPVA
jgi:hypothetical protein